jgi:hypothetical protein
MPPNQDSIRVRILLHSLLQTLPQILLVRRVLDNGYAQAIVVAKVALLAAALGDALDLLDLLDLEARGGAQVALHEEGDEDGPLRVRVDAAAGAAVEGGHEEGGAGGGLEDLINHSMSVVFFLNA